MKKQKCVSLLGILLLSSSLVHAKECSKNVELTAPDSRYELLGGGKEVRDKKTGLIWQRCSLGQAWDGKTCANSTISYTWEEALKESKALGNGYRLPNIRELLTLVEYACRDTAINETYFPRTSYSFYWSSSPVGQSENSASAYYVYFEVGSSGTNPMWSKNKVRAVRTEN
ncbi:MAG: DUF1566 domain-containing protein [Flavobacterium sp.]|nr:MAG: DUF1566 domain-containing protein [Flavobacterium sp.]